jgi:hypothetical protein
MWWQRRRFVSEKRMDNLCGRKDGICQEHLLKDPNVAFVFAVNIQARPLAFMAVRGSPVRCAHGLGG